MSGVSDKHFGLLVIHEAGNLSYLSAQVGGAPSMGRA